MKYIDRFLNKITMYRLVLYVLIILLVLAEIFSLIGWIPYNPIYLALDTIFLLIMALAANNVFAFIFKEPVNLESAYITALILALIISPASTAGHFLFLGWAAVLAMASKYILAFNRKQIFNPAAIAVVITSLVAGQSASWWVGTAIMAPFVLLGGLLIVRKTQRSALMIAFFITTLASIGFYALQNGSSLVSTWFNVFLYVPIMFFAFVMLTEPLTMPPTRNLQILYGLAVGMMFAPQNHLGSLYSTPELALVAGNLFSYLISPKLKFIMPLKRKIKRANGVYDFVFAPPRNFKFLPGQYLEWTLEHNRTDARGSRRYFTIASSPTENDLVIGVKFYELASSFKRKLFHMGREDYIEAGQLAGNFTLPRNPDGKYVFIAGGIGVTPFRSMIKYLSDKQIGRDIVMFYSNRQAQDIAYQEVFERAKKRIGLKMVYTLSDKGSVPDDWGGRIGSIDQDMIREEVPDYKERTFYISGPRSMVEAFKKNLRNMGVGPSRIKSDFFPGLV